MLAKGVVLEHKRSYPAYMRLQDVSKQLETLVSRSRGRSNKDLARLADQIKAVMERWDS